MANPKQLLDTFRVQASDATQLRQAKETWGKLKPFVDPTLGQEILHAWQDVPVKGPIPLHALLDKVAAKLPKTNP